MSGGRLGVAALINGKPLLTYNADRRFLTCSTFKLLVGAAVLQRVDRGRERFDRAIPFNRNALLKYAPVTRKRVDRGYMTVEELCAAALEYSDNTAANLLLETLGGPRGLTSFARTIGDLKTHMEHYEPQLNDSPPDGVADTTTPLAIAMDAHAVVFGDVLKPQSRERMAAWLKASKTGETLVRAGVPASWQAGDKSGTGGGVNAHGDSDTRNDVAVLWRPHQPPVAMAVYLTKCTLPAQKRDATLSAVGRIVAERLQ